MLHLLSFLSPIYSYNIIILSCQACGLTLAACGLLLCAVNLQPSPVLHKDQGPFGPASSTAHQQLPCSGPPGILKLLVRLFPTRKISCQLEARTVAPSGTRPLCPGFPVACCLPAGTLLSIFAFLPFYNLWLCFVGARHFVCSLLTFVPSRYTI